MRLVGYYEFGNALRDLDKLIRLSSEDEVYELDKIVAEKDEFTIYTNLSRKLKSGPSSLNEPIENERERRGLRWVTALARVELGSMLAAFTGVPTPYEIVANPKFDLPQYQELLLDGARTHYWALVNDPSMPKITRSLKVDEQVLSYSRRLVMARAMLRAAVKSNIRDYSPVQLRELASWKESLDEAQSLIAGKIRAFVNGSTTTQVTSKSSSRDFTAACSAMLRAEARELKAGTANVTNY